MPSGPTFDEMVNIDAYASILDSRERLIWHANARNESVPQTELYYHKLLIGLDPSDPVPLHRDVTTDEKLSPPTRAPKTKPPTSSPASKIPIGFSKPSSGTGLSHVGVGSASAAVKGKGKAQGEDGSADKAMGGSGAKSGGRGRLGGGSSTRDERSSGSSASGGGGNGRTATKRVRRSDGKG